MSQSAQNFTILEMFSLRTADVLPVRRERSDDWKYVCRPQARKCSTDESVLYVDSSRIFPVTGKTPCRWIQIPRSRNTMNGFFRIPRLLSGNKKPQMLSSRNTMNESNVAWTELKCESAIKTIIFLLKSHRILFFCFVLVFFFFKP